MKTRLLPIAFALAAASFGAAEGAPVRTAPQLLTAKGHDMTYFVSLPPGHDAKKTWPVLVVIPDAAHLPNIEAPERFNAVVGDFLRSISRPHA